MGKGAVFVVLAHLLVDVALAVFSFVARGVVQLLDLVMGRGAQGVLAVVPPALHVGVGHTAGVAAPVTLVVVVVAAGQFMQAVGLLTIGTQLCFESLQFEPEKLIPGQEGLLVAVGEVAIESQGAAVVAAFGRFVGQGVVVAFVVVVAVEAGLSGAGGTSSLQLQRSEG